MRPQPGCDRDRLPSRHTPIVPARSAPYDASVIIDVTGAQVGRAIQVRAHPNGQHIWLVDVMLAKDTSPVQIVFGGTRIIEQDELVPVAPPGAKVSVHDPGTGITRVKKMRARNYRGERSNGMLCSLAELGWLRGGPNEVAILRDLAVGQSLDHLLADDYPRVVRDWGRAERFARG